MKINVLEYLEASAARFPEKTAYADEERELSFSRVLSMAKNLGTALAKRHGGAGASSPAYQTGIRRPVGVLTSRDARCVAAFFGVLYSGNYYVPIDREMPRERMEKIEATLKPLEIIDPISDALWAEAEAGWRGVEDEALLAARRAAVLDVDPVYAIFTSGSTGDPKGIVISHRSVIDFTDWFVSAGRFTEADVLGNQAPFYFDLSVKDIYTAAATGATVHIIPKKLFMFPALLVQFLQEKSVTAIVWATSAFHLVANSGALEQAKLPALRTAILGGEALRAKQLNVWVKTQPNVRYINLYGPTEVTVDCTWFPIEREFADDEDIPIGRACANKEVLLLGEDLKPCAPGEAGEICVRGTGLAKGYIGDWEKTRAAFIQDPRNSAYPDLIYRTGDLGVMDETGCISFLSRRDGQIKHMSYRIELGEIETALAALDGIDEAVCFFEQERDKIHCAYTGTAESGAVAKTLRARLPKYMIPNLYHRLDALPHNANGKIDRKAIAKEFLG